MLDVPASSHFRARQRPAAHKHAHRQHTLQGEGTQAGGWGVGVPDCNFFEPGGPSQRDRVASSAPSARTKSASSYPPAGIRQALTVCTNCSPAAELAQILASTPPRFNSLTSESRAALSATTYSLRSGETSLRAMRLRGGTAPRHSAFEPARAVSTATQLPSEKSLVQGGRDNPYPP